MDEQLTAGQQRVRELANEHRQKKVSMETYDKTTSQLTPEVDFLQRLSSQLSQEVAHLSGMKYSLSFESCKKVQDALAIPLATLMTKEDVTPWLQPILDA